MQHYQDVGEIAHALSWHADEILAGLAGDELAVEQTFRSLAEIDTEGRIIRRGRQFKELVAESGVPKEKMQTVVDRFRDEDCSFLTPPRSEGGIEPNTPIDVGHEALLRRWERVSGDPRNGSPYLCARCRIWPAFEVDDPVAPSPAASIGDATISSVGHRPSSIVAPNREQQFR